MALQPRRDKKILTDRSASHRAIKHRLMSCKKTCRFGSSNMRVWLLSLNCCSSFTTSAAAATALPIYANVAARKA